MNVAFLDWPAVAAIIGVANAIGSHWLQNRREQREEKKLTDRLNNLEANLKAHHKLLNTHDALLVSGGALMTECRERLDALEALLTEAEDEQP